MAESTPVNLRLWTSRSGAVRICDMTDAHLINSYRMVKDYKTKESRWLKLEIEKRGLSSLPNKKKSKRVKDLETNQNQLEKEVRELRLTLRHALLRIQSLEKELEAAPVLPAPGPIGKALQKVDQCFK